MEKIDKFYVLINNKNNITLNGVINVSAFDESYITLETEQGKVRVEGSSLKIENLSKLDGEIYVTGNIGAVIFEEEKAPRGAFKKLFK